VIAANKVTREIVTKKCKKRSDAGKPRKSKVNKRAQEEEASDKENEGGSGPRKKKMGSTSINVDNLNIS
jgi:hypothetical protein